MQAGPIVAQFSSLFDSPIKIIILLLLLVIGWLLGKYIPGWPPGNSRKGGNPLVLLPADRIECPQDADQGCDCSDKLASGLKITAKGLPPGIHAYVIPDKIEDEAVKNYLGFEYFVANVGNIVFGDGTYVVNKFDKPVSMTLSYDPQKLAEANERNKTSYKESDLVPIALISPFGNVKNCTTGATIETKAWVAYPKDAYQVDTTKHEVTVTFTTWGDQPTGWGTPPK